MNLEEALKIVEDLVCLKREHLNPLQKSIIKASWENYTYKDAIAECRYSYNEGHIKNAASDLWKKLKKALKVKKVTKKNFRGQLEEYCKSPQFIRQQQVAEQSQQFGTNLCHEDWGNAPDISSCYGRSDERKHLENWILNESCKLILLLGQGGIGKTTLSIKLAQEIKNSFNYVIWRSLEDSPPIDKILADAIAFLSEGQDTILPDTLERQINKLIHYLEGSRCLLILDNAESILQSGNRVGQYRAGYEGYGHLFARIASYRHQSCLVVTSREQPEKIDLMVKKNKTIQSLVLDGLNVEACEEILRQFHGFSELEDEGKLRRLIEHYGGNPFALEVIAASLPSSEVLAGLIEDLNSGQKLDVITDLLEVQFKRLSDSEQQILYSLAINYEAVSDRALKEDILSPQCKKELLQSLASLQRRSLVKNTEIGYTQLPVLREYVLNRLIDAFCREIKTGQVELLNAYYLCKATSKDYIRETQVRKILEPLCETLLLELGGSRNVEKILKDILSSWQKESPQAPGYLAGNIINIFTHLKIDLNNYDFSNLTICQAYLQGAKLHDVDFTNSNVSKSFFSQPLGSILSVAFSYDGQFWATGDADKNLYIWRVADGQLVATCIGHTNWVRSITFHPKKLILASASSDRTVRLWKINKDEDEYECESLGTLAGHTDHVWSVAFSPDGNKLASASADRSVRLWDINSHQCLHILQEHRYWVIAVAFNPDGTIIASASVDRTVKLWDIQTGQCRTTWQQGHYPVRSIAFSPDGNTLAIGGDDKLVRLLDIQDGKCLKEFSGHEGRVWSVAFSPNGKILASGSADRTVKLWDIETGQLLFTLPERDRRVRSISFSPNGETLISGSDDQSVRLWNVPTGESLKTIYGYTQRVWSVAFSTDGKTLVSGSDDRTIKLWDIQTGHCKILGTAQKRVQSVAFHPQGKKIASGANDGRVQLWAIETDECLTLPEKHADWIWLVAFYNAGNKLISAGDDGQIKFWDVKTCQCLNTLKDYPYWIWSIAPSPDAKQIAIGSDSKVVQIWNVETDRLTDLGEHHSRVRAVAWSPNGQFIASGSDDLTIKLWDVSTGKCLHTLAEHTKQIRPVAISSNSQIVASGGDDLSIKLWDVQSGRCLRTFTGHINTVRSVVFSPDGSILASGSEDETIKLWNLETGVCIKTLKAERLYEGMKITNMTGVTKERKTNLKLLGSVEN